MSVFLAGLAALGLCLGADTELDRARAENALLRARLQTERARSAQLVIELARLEGRWVQRELELVRFQREWAQWRRGGAISEGLRTLLGLPPEEPEETAEPAALPDAPDPDVVRAGELRLALDAMVRAEGLRGMQVFELGTVLRDEQGQPIGAGPAFVRLFDENGRSAGHLQANRLTLEASRGGRTVSLLFHEGAHHRSGVALPFPGGLHRVTLRHADPDPFFERTPELFGPVGATRVMDDGIWSPSRLTYELNRLLAADASADRYRLEYFDGVNGRDWLDVELSVRDRKGAIVRRIVADRMHLELLGSGVRLELRDGVSIRGGVQMPFLDGELSIWLPRADLPAWRSAELPGLVEAPSDDA